MERKYGWIDKDGKLFKDEDGNYRIFNSKKEAEEIRKYYVANWGRKSFHKSDPELHQQDPIKASVKDFKELKSVLITDKLFKS